MPTDYWIPCNLEIRNRCDKNIQFVRNITIFWGFCLLFCLYRLWFFLLAARTPGYTQHRSCWLVRYGVVYPGFVRHSSSFSGTGNRISANNLAREKRMAVSHCLYIWNSCMIEQSRSKDPYAAFGGNMAALQRNQVSVVGLKTHMPPLAEIWLLCSVSNAPVAQMKLHEGNILLYFITGPPVVKLSQCPYIATQSRM